MGLLDQVLGSVMGNTASGGSPLQSILMNILGGGQQAGGGLGGLLSSFEQAGLGHIAQSWVGTGQNQPVSPGQLQNVFGESAVQQMSSQAGIPPHDFLSQLSQHLPNVVNRLTPDGRVPDEGTMSV